MFRLLSTVFVFAICMFGISAEDVKAAPCAEVAFGAASYYPSGQGTYGLASGDLNGDGKSDLVSANEDSGSVVVRFGDGMGGFPSSVQFFEISPSSVAVADFNRDGNLDLATSNRSISFLTVRLGLGGGAFGPPTQTSIAPSPSGVATGDFNGDGNIDIVTSSGGSDTISLLLGNASGSFPVATSFFIGRGSGSFGIATADFNGDGNRDVATANRGSANISVLLGNGSGGFVSAVVYPAGSEPFNISIGDFNGDAKPDIVTANLGSNNLTVRINDGLGDFSSGTTLASSTETLSVATGDLDGDGDAEIVATNHGSNNFSVFRGNGNGTFAPGTNFALNSAPRALTLGDLNYDGSIDVAMGVDSGNIAVLLNACSSNSPPIISASSVSRQQDTASSNVAIAMVGDAEDNPATLAVSVNGASSATVNGVTVSHISVGAKGNVAADITAGCGAFSATFNLTVTDAEGLFATAVLNVNVTNETTPPVINKGNPIPDVIAYLPLDSPDVSLKVTFNTPTATDNCTELPVVTTTPVSGSLFSLGTTVVNVSATDELNNAAMASFNVKVLFNFGGFLQPINPLPALNVVSAGSSVPLKFSLNGNKGLNVLAKGYPASSTAPCDSNEPGSTIEEVAGGGLSYDVSSDHYTYVWKTSKAFESTCRLLTLRLTDGTEHYVKFSFR